MSVQTLGSTFASDVATYIAAKTLMIAKKSMAMYQLCDKPAQPKNSGVTFQYTRYDRLPLPQSKLSEGVSPSETSMSISTVQAVQDQWGAVVSISDVAIDSVKHPVLQMAINLLANQAQETLDREISKVAFSGTNVFYPNAVTQRSSLASTDKMSSASIGKVIASLRDGGAIPFDGDLFLGVVGAFSEDDIMNDATFVDAAKYGAVKKLYNQEIGTWKGVRWIRSNTLPSIKILGGASGTGSGTAGSLAASTTYNAKLAVVDKNTGQESFISASFNAATGMGQSSVDITVPALPAGSTAGSLFRLYFGSNGGTLYLAANDIAASSTYNQKTVPTSGDVAQAQPPAAGRVYHALVVGQQALACVELNKIEAFLTPRQASDSDPLVQRRKAGWKTMFKAVICNDLFLARLEHETTNG
jgi:N4-gp56 family major capsid protein